MTGTVSVLYFSISKAFITVSHNSLIDKLMVYGLDLGQGDGFTSQKCWAQNLITRGRKSSQRLVLKGIAQGSVLGSNAVEYCH